MFKKIREHFRLKKYIQIEVLETLCSICLYLERDSYRTSNPIGRNMRGHYTNLSFLRNKLIGKRHTYDFESVEMGESVKKSERDTF